jgi:phage baseplate assembly protein W
MSKPDMDFLGTGWSFPPTFSRFSASVDMVSNNQDIQESLWVLFSTSLGERIMLPQYGTQIWRMVFRNPTNTLMTQLKEMVQQAILNWEPRIDVVNIAVAQDATTDGLLLIRVDYIIRMTNARNNLVYPFYINEATIPQVKP